MQTTSRTAVGIERVGDDVDENRARTRLTKLALVIHVEHPVGARLVMLGKTCRLCAVCEVLIAHEHEVTPLLMASIADLNVPPRYVVLGIIERRVWRAGMTGGVTLEAMKESMADFKQYLRIEVTPGGWFRDGHDPARR